MLNVLSDGTAGTVLFAILARRSSGRANLFRTLSRFASGLSDTAKAFLIIAGTRSQCLLRQGNQVFFTVWQRSIVSRSSGWEHRKESDSAYFGRNATELLWV